VGDQVLGDGTDCVVDDDPVGVLARDVGPRRHMQRQRGPRRPVRSEQGPVLEIGRGHDRSEADRIGAERGVGEEHLQGAQQAPSNAG